ncbi:hypothetical protein [Lactococcus allomyrinae]|uniref:Uncharacterized protein n=1 Tax=Lactococcus allomyrinae TaxID=2419773 RepID=A0A387BMR4_9LACT|nr:hypothetical protein [Lactococcus allomyrinae]AYF99820.1 hypothetical protein D7I46_01200 [Lactococcus allomyrinae]
MEKIKNSELYYKIKFIKNIMGGNQEFSIIFESDNKEEYKLYFGPVYEMRYTVEMANISRFSDAKFIEELSTDILLIENSDYVNSLEEAMVYAYSLENIKHYFIHDEMDTVIDVLANGEPRIEKISKSESTDLLKKEVKHLKWWDNNENISLIQKELEDLRAYKLKREQEDKKAREDEIARNSFGF